LLKKEVKGVSNVEFTVRIIYVQVFGGIEPPLAVEVRP
jgi:hypothetical protein